MENQLAERIAINAWRLRRAYRVESGLFEHARSAWRDGAIERSSKHPTSILSFCASAAAAATSSVNCHATRRQSNDPCACLAGFREKADERFVNPGRS
jgi:hypothetical protein